MLVILNIGLVILAVLGVLLYNKMQKFGQSLETNSTEIFRYDWKPYTITVKKNQENITKMERSIIFGMLMYFELVNFVAKVHGFLSDKIQIQKLRQKLE